MAEKKVIVVVESTAAMEPYWDTLQMEYLNKIVKSLCGNEPSVSKAEFALVTYHTHGCYSPILVQRTGCTRDPDVFLEWLSSIPFSGGGFNDAAIAEGLAEALVMFPPSQSGSPIQQNVDMHMHCILVAASNPHPLKTPVYVRESIDSDTGNYKLYDAEAVAKVFPQFSISLSVICPRQLLKIKAIYNAGKQNNSAVDPPVDAKTTHDLILISEGFREARAALSRCRTNLSSNQSHEKVEAVSQLASVNGSTRNWQPIPARTVTPASSGYLTASTQVGQNSSPASIMSATSNFSSYPNTEISQPLANNIHGVVSTGQQVKMSQNVKNGLDQSGGTGAMIPTPGMPQHVKSGTQPLANNAVATNMPLSQQTASAQPKYIKVWEGSLSGLRQGESVFITKLEGYGSPSVSETLTANWPPVIEIARVISQDFMNNKQYVGMANFLVFRALYPHGFLGQLKEKKRCAVIQLPSQTLILSVSDKSCRLIGMLFPRDIVAFQPPLSSQQQQQQHQQMQSQQQQMVGAGRGQTYVRDPRCSQMVSQGQVSSQGATNIDRGNLKNM